MSFDNHYTPESISPEELAHTQGPLLIEFGTNWCGFCQSAQRHIEAAMERHSGVEHVKVEDGKGRRLGRTLGVKLWPTLIFFRDGHEITRLIRPDNREDIETALAHIQDR
ncbi:thiol reductase thioredoxin [Marinobacter vulgaris]|uniref:Thiol reductase thioredoxin n=1 Tax=Marinobacter vulgaris TaxID=1928331 RepID=A0A2V3ZZT5_9GAMM|nr:thioredoxin family protein [Marinobacter vulgaris]PXX91640.1 thiol reductase thioredoxin [Marinobacter vulgaris]TSJ70855.1 thioredoxin family protein [Marinobacter vulgaris]